MVYHGIFSSLLPYDSQIWGQSNQSVPKMEKLQNKALRIINFKPLRYYVNPLYNKCEILKFGDSIKLQNLLYAHDNKVIRVICQQPCVLVLQFWIVNTRIEIKKVTR